MKIIRFVLILIVPFTCFSQKLLNTNKPQHNMYAHSINVLLDSVKTEKEEYILLSGQEASTIEDWTISSKILNSSTNNIFKSDYNLTNEYKWLVGKNHIRIHLKDEYVLRSNVVIPLFYIKTYYSNKRKSNMYEYGTFIFYYVFNCKTDSFQLENIERNSYK